MLDLFKQLKTHLFPHLHLITIKWLRTCALDLLFNVICYITNPIIILFADEEGNLPKKLRWWQTYDNCLDVEWMVTEGIVPKIFQYDFNKHYRYTYEEKDSFGNIIPGFVEIVDPNFTWKERIQRYFCRLAWLNRNAAYGYSYEVSGIMYKGSDMTIHMEKPHYRVITLPNGDFDIKMEIKWYCSFLKKHFDCDVYLGWKLIANNTSNRPTRAMLAMRVSPFHKWKWND